MQVRHYNYASSDCDLVLNIRSVTFESEPGITPANRTPSAPDAAVQSQKIFLREGYARLGPEGLGPRPCTPAATRFPGIIS